MPIDGRTISQPLLEEADVVIIGSGAGGAPLAWRLANAGQRVVVLEEGGKFTVKDFNRNAYDMTKKMYRGMATMVTLGKPSIPLPTGRTYGGTTTINSGTCFRIPGKVLAKWRTDYGLTGLTEKYLDPYFDLAEEKIHVEDVNWDTMSAGNQLFGEGARALGYHGAPLRRNQKECMGAGICAFGCPNDAKQPMHLNFLPEAEAAGARVYTFAKAKRILTHRGRAMGVTGRFHREDGMRVEFSIRAGRVVVAAGAVGTPYLLLKNKLANGSRHVGRHLRIHPAAKVLGFMDHEVRPWTGTPQAYGCDALMDEGLIFEGFFVPPSMLAFALPAGGAKLKDYMANYNRMVGFGVMVSDTSEGRVMAPPFGNDPLMLYNLNRRDTETFVKGIRLAAHIYFEAGAKPVIPPVFGVDEIHSPDDIDRLLDPAKIKPTDLELMAFHPMGTCRMSADPRKGVVNESLETHDVKGLYVVDGSVFPTSLGVNPQEGIMAFSLMAADRMLGA